MCGRFWTAYSWDALWTAYGLKGPQPPQAMAPRYNIAPGQPVVAICRKAPVGPREVLPLVWGLVPGWARTAPAEPRLFNARAETVGEKPSFRNPLKRRRCLIPANGYYEWKAVRGSARQPYLVRAQDGGLLSIAGLWEQWVGADGSEIWSCTVLTTAATPYLAQLNRRMPVVLPPESHGAWMDPIEKRAALVLPLLRPAEGLEALPLGPAVNDARYQGADCAEPVGDVLPERLRLTGSKG